MNEVVRQNIIKKIEELKDKVTQLAFQINIIGADRDLDEALFILSILNIKFEKILENKARTINVKFEIKV
jgi:hypothetical protein